MDIGILLKQAREGKGLTLDEIQEQTKIQKRYLISIEENDFGALPGQFYAKAFVKQYAQAVDLDPEMILANFKVNEEIPSQPPVRYSRMNRSNKSNNTVASIFSNLPIIIVILLIISILIVAIIYSQQSKSGSEGETINNDGTDDVVVHKNDEKEESETGENKTSDEKKKLSNIKVIETGTGTAPESTIELSDVGDEVILKIETSSDTYLDVKDEDDEVYYADMFTSNTTENEFDFSGQDKIYLNVGYASDVSIEVNGTKIEFPVDPTESVHQKLWINLK